MRKLSLIVIAGLILSFLNSPAARADTVTFPCGGSATYSVLMPQGVLLDGKKCTGPLVIDGSVKIIDRQAFLGAKITSVVFPSSVTKIDSSAFSQTHLTTLELPNTVTEFGELAFSSTPLRSVKLPSTLLKISDGLFLRTKLEKIEIPNSVTSIGSLAFAETELTEIQVPDSVTQIYMKTFSGNLKLVSVSLPDSLLGIWGDAFDRAYALTTISYCGMAKLPTLIIPTTCPPERKAVIDAKLAADKLAADKVDLQARINSASAALAQLDAEVDSLMKQYPSMKAELILYKKKIALFANLNQQNLGTAELNLVSLISKLNSVKLTYKKIARGITCVKGNRTLKVVDVKPKCPAGYKKK